MANTPNVIHHRASRSHRTDAAKLAAVARCSIVRRCDLGSGFNHLLSQNVARWGDACTDRNAVLPTISSGLTSAFNRWPRIRALIGWFEPRVLLLFLVGVVGPGVLFVLSFWVEVALERVFLVFVPPYIALVAIGLVSLKPASLQAVTSAVLACTLLAGLAYSNTRVLGFRDYKTLSQRLSANLQAGDVIFTPHRSWEATALYYYMPEAPYVTEAYSEIVAAGAERIWLVTWPHENDPPVHDERHDALESYVVIDQLTARRARAALYAPSTKDN